ncbi:MAG TPA: RNA methyltransferase, partial [Anaerolineales bacterium]|nr:RNA methyltransferase [Anaerolineales bacterium]
ELQVGGQIVITSSQNSKLKLVRTLMGRAKERREANAFVVEGVRLIEEAVNAGWQFQFALYSDGLSERGQSLIETLSTNNIEVNEVAGDLLQKLSDTETPQGILAVLELTNLPIPNSPNFILIPDQIRDPGNLGTLLRTAAATDVQVIFLPPETTDVFSPKILRAGMGAHFRLPIHSMTWEEIKTQTKDGQILLADMDGTSCWETDLRKPLALIIGGEAEGASDEAQRLAAQKISVPMAGNVESLNAGVAGSVLMFEVVRQRS